MNVMGFSSSSRSCPPATRDTDPSIASPSNFDLASRSNAPGELTHPSRSASVSTSSNPTLCRVPTYALPGLPRPTTSFMESSAEVRVQNAE
jgi:hypothetical protein